MKTIIETLNNPTDDGLYSLKALHQASGGLDKDKPNRWLRSQAVTNSIRFLESQVTNSGFGELVFKTEKGGDKKGGDTFVCRKLVYSYAMWISDEFHFMVIDTFDQLVNATTTQEVIDLKFQLDNALQQDLFTKAQQPRDKNCLQVLMNCTPFQVNQFYDELEYQGQVKSRLVPQPPKRIFEATESSTCVIGKKGDTLLFDESVRDLFPAQQNWTD